MQLNIQLYIMRDIKIIIKIFMSSLSSIFQLEYLIEEGMVNPVKVG